MGVDLRQGAGLAQFREFLGGQGVELGLGHGEEGRDRLQFAGGAVGVLVLIGGLTGVHQVHALHQVDKGPGHPVLGLEVVAELDALLGVLGGLAVFEERELRVFGHELIAAIDADQHPLLTLGGGLAGRQYEGVAADIAGDIGVDFEAEIRGGEEVLTFLQAHHRNRLVVLADEDDRIGQAGRAELGHGEGDHVRLGGEAKTRRGRIDPKLPVDLAREQLGLGIEHDVAGKGYLLDWNGFHGPCSRW